MPGSAVAVLGLAPLPARLRPRDNLDSRAFGSRRASRFPALKIKVGSPNDLSTLEAVRAVYDGPLRVDANTGWQPDMALELLPELQRLGVELIEQPFPAHDLAGLGWLQEHSALPIVADESAVNITHLDQLASAWGCVPEAGWPAAGGRVEKLVDNIVDTDASVGRSASLEWRQIRAGKPTTIPAG